MSDRGNFGAWGLRKFFVQVQSAYGLGIFSRTELLVGFARVNYVDIVG
jgi:hypothetical protein